MRTDRSALSLVLAALASVTLPASRAEACGGFFCNGSAAVVQAGENIVFAQDGAFVEAVVQVLYDGAPYDFAWIVPTPSEPEVGLGSEELFPLLAASAVQNVSVFESQGECGWCADESVNGDMDSAGGDYDGSGPEPVWVERQEQLGPYDYVVLRATDDAALFDWLSSNGFNLPAQTASYVEPYVLMSDETRFVAFKLTKEATSGEIRPIRLRYRAEQPMIPIQLTAIAAAPQMPVYVSLLGPARAVPLNYLHAVPHPFSSLNGWGSAEETDFVTAAVAEAGGQAFVTSYAGPRPDHAALTAGLPSLNADAVRASTDGASLVRAIQAGGFERFKGVRSVLRRFMPPPVPLPICIGSEPEFYDELLREGAFGPGGEMEWDGDWYDCTESGECGGPDQPPCTAHQALTGLPVDAAGAADALDEEFVQPLRLDRAMVERSSHLTRLVTVMDAEQMTVDPVFGFNPDLPEVTAGFTRETVSYCRPDAAAGITLETHGDGRSLIEPQNVPPTAGAFRTLALDHAEQLAEAGEPVTVIDNRLTINRSIQHWNAPRAGVPMPVLSCRLDDYPPDSTEAALLLASMPRVYCHGAKCTMSDGFSDEADGCSAASGGGVGLVGAAGGALVAALGRRRRQAAAEARRQA